MKKIAVALVIFLLIGTVAGCGAIQQQLSAPTGVAINGSRIQWNSVESASGYILMSGETEIATTSNTFFDLSTLDLIVGQTYQISVKAKGDGYIKLGSEPSTTVSYTHTASSSSPTQGQGSSSDTESIVITPVSDVSVGNKLFGSGLGYGVNALTAKRAVGGVRLAEFFDNSLLTIDNIGSYDIGSSRSRAISRTSIKDEVIAVNTKLVYGSSAEASLAGMFTAGFEEKFSLNTAAESELHVNQFYFILNMYSIGKNYQMTNYQQPRAYSNKISAEALEDIRDLNDGTLEPETFFNRYGTHLVMAVSYGGMTEVNYASFSTKTLDAVSIASTLEAKLNAGFSYGIASASASAEIGAELDTTYRNNTEERISNLYIESIGKTGLTALTFDGFASEYKQWVAQFDNEDNYRIVDIADGGLVPIWSYIPSEYSHAAQRLEEFFNNKATAKGVALANKMTPPIVEDKGDTVHFGGGKGTPSDPYIISSVNHLENIIQYGKDKYYSLANDLTLGEWIPLGSYSMPHNNSVSDLSNYFGGHFDGKGHKISYTIAIAGTAPDNNYGWALFGCAKNATFENVVLDVSITGDTSSKSTSPVAGSLVGWATDCSFSNCMSYGTIRQDHNGSNNYGCVRSGGLVGMATGSSFYRCINYCDILAGGFYATAGGIVGGMSNCTFDSCSNRGTVSANHGAWWFGSHNYGELYGTI